MAARKWKTARVFISSTFRDMHAERDHLIKVTFPRLRQWCEKRRLHLVDIDLRWGVTKEEADNGKAIEICLKEIDGSRPFFVCILCNRYGWVPEQLPPEEQYRFQGIQKRSGMSITHLEITHATGTPIERADKKPQEACPHAFFYFRKDGCVPPTEELTGLTDAEKSEHSAAFFEPLSKCAELLKALKEDVSRRFKKDDRVYEYAGVWDAGAENPEDQKLKGRLTQLEAFGSRVESDLIRAIGAQFADHIAAAAERPDPLDEERALHDAFIEDRTQVHVPRNDIEEELTGYAAGDDNRVLVLSGPPGSGKSAILAHWVQARLQAQSQETSREFLVARFVGASPASTSPRGLLGSVSGELLSKFQLTEEVDEEAIGPGGKKQKHRVTRPMEVPADTNEVLSKWPRFLEAAGKKGRIVIVLDALNQLERGADPSRAYWIPGQLPGGVRLIVSAIDNGEASKADTRSALPAPGQSPPPADWLGTLRRRKINEVPVKSLAIEERKAIIKELPSVFCKTLDDDQKAALLENEATCNPLFLTVALEELRLFGSFERLREAIAGLPRLDAVAAGGGIDAALDRLFGQVLDRLERESDRQTPGLVRKLFSLLACARDGLSEQELDGLLSQALPTLTKDVRQGNMQIALRQVRPYLQRKRVWGTVLLDFYHRSFWKAVVGKYLPGEETKTAMHVEIAEFFESRDWFTESLEAQRARVKQMPPTPRPVDLRKVVELPWQRLEAAKLGGKGDAKSPYWDTVADLLQNWQFLEAKAEADPDGKYAAEQAATTTAGGGPGGASPSQGEQP